MKKIYILFLCFIASFVFTSCENALLIDVCSRFGLEFNKFRIINSPLCVLFGVAF